MEAVLIGEGEILQISEGDSQLFNRVNSRAYRSIKH